MVQWSSCAVLRHTRWVACPWVCDRPRACRQTAHSQSMPEQNLLPKGIVNRLIFDSEDFRVNRLSSIKVTSRFSPHLFYRSQTKVKTRKQDCRLNPRMKLGTRELQQCYPTPRKLPNLIPQLIIAPQLPNLRAGVEQSPDSGWEKPTSNDANREKATNRGAPRFL